MKDNRPLGWGYNGFVAGVKDDDEKWGKEEKLKYVIHSERNAIANSVRAGVSNFEGSCMYIWTSSPHRVYLPCHDCAREIVTYGIPVVNVITTRDIAENGPKSDSRWQSGLSMEIFESAGVKIIMHSAEEVNKWLFGSALKHLIPRDEMDA
jgi:dCMP deaminase